MELTPRDRTEEHEHLTLAPYAAKSDESLGREHPASPDTNRTEFARDSDRIYHSDSFHRLKGKTQVFMDGEGDHYRNRLTHTLEVMRVSRMLARSLRLNEDLTESIALAHDLGHTPFGHAGQDALNAKMQKPFGKKFEHNEQSRRIVEVLERKYPGIAGLNLTLEVRDGLAKHTSLYDQAGLPQKTNTLEAQVVNLGDEIAYHHHDLQDGLRSGILTIAGLSQLPIMEAALEDVLRLDGKLQGKMLNERLRKALIAMLTEDVIKETNKRIKDLGITNIEAVRSCPTPIVSLSPEMRKRVGAFASHLYRNFYTSPYVKQQAHKGQKVIADLFDFYREQPGHLPSDEKERIRTGESIEDVVKDYISGMTDAYAIRKYQEAFPDRPPIALEKVQE